MNAVRPLVVGLLAGAVSLGAVPLAHAAFRNSGAASSSFTTAALAPPTGATLSKACVIAAPLLGVGASGTFTASWTPSTTSWAQGQRVLLLTAGGVPVGVERSLGPGATSSAFEVLVPVGTYQVRISTVYAGWTAETTTAAVGC